MSKETAEGITVFIFFILSIIAGAILGLTKKEKVCIEYKEEPIIKTECRPILWEIECIQKQEMKRSCVKHE